MLGRRRSGSAALLLALFCAAAGCAASQQLSAGSGGIQGLRPYVETIIAEKLQGGLHGGLQGLRPYVETIIKEKLQGLLSKLEAKIEALDSRLELKIEALDSKLESKSEALDITLQAHQSQLDGVVVKVNNSQLQTANLTSLLGGQGSQVTSLASKLDNLELQLSGLTDYIQVGFSNEQSRLDEEINKTISQQSQIDELIDVSSNERSRLNITINTTISQQSQIEKLIDVSNHEQSQLDEEINKTISQQTEIDELTDIFNHEKSRLDEEINKTISQQSQIDELFDVSSNEQSRLDSTINTATSQKTQIEKLADRLAKVVSKPKRSVVSETLPRDCSELPAGAKSGVYLLHLGPTHAPSAVVQHLGHAYCDMDTDGGNWTVFQRRTEMEPHQDFFLGWVEYKDGFGELREEFWWGLHKLWRMTSTQNRQYQLRIDLEDFNGEKAHAKYNVFRVSSEEEGYRLSVSYYSGNAGDALRKSNGMKFSTRDKDQDKQGIINCAEKDEGAWWYDRCGHSSLNGRYQDGPRETWQGIWWYTWMNNNKSLKKVELKIRRV